MKRMPVTSATLTSVGYNPDTLTLELEFIDGEVYRYSKVPPSVYLDLMNAKSKGLFFNTRVKGVYEYEKMTKYFG